jgi:hypothetical protein
MHGIYLSVFNFTLIMQIKQVCSFGKLGHQCGLGNIRENIKTIAKDGQGHYELVYI